ncbi:MAG: Cytosol aminopeptidase PepA [uncultured Nocardioidaceae bacterium]|uniref:Probable cytosol aminopeptidase n=1 Tax=uncultured Nocardioidaceae bacterium TaxID=253824 RepID=A0A6J4M0I1_9ACTN|nr:MAG: Cytosol aminopeptidase PepA [uncultured Nocardioidaceae bacterium]
MAPHSIAAMTSIVLRAEDPVRTGTDVVVVGLLAPAAGTSEAGPGAGPTVAPGGESVAAAYGDRLGRLLGLLGATGKQGQTAAVAAGDGLEADLVVFVGLGSEVHETAVRRAAGAAARAVTGASSVALALPADSPARVRAVVEGFLLGGYRFDAYRSGPAEEGPGEVVVLTAAAEDAATTAAADLAQHIAAAVAGTRDWVNTPPGDLTPPVFADAVVGAGEGRGTVEVVVLDEDELAARGCGGILGVGRGSASPPRLVQLTYRGPRADGAGPLPHLALVGKGITYDSGGLSIKPAASMTTMKMDMAGAAAVVRATYAVADLALPVDVTTFVPMAENMVSGSATRPGDVLTMYRGRTVEVLNTDAEGRLVLADALGHAVEAEPDLVVDVATLTGACVVALGDRVAGLFGTEAAVEQVQAAADRAGEALWHMPIPDEMVEKVRGNSKVADLAQHNTERWGGASYAAAFLREFVGDLPWAHIDIAGPAFNDGTAHGHVTAGGTGVAVATLVELARDLADTPEA